MRQLMTMENVGLEMFHPMQQKLEKYRSESWTKWMVYQYDRPHSRFVLWGIEGEKAKIVPIAQQTYQETLKMLSNAYELLECGPIKANFQSGLICTHINSTTSTLRLDLQNVPNLQSNELKYWLKKNLEIELNELKDHGFYPSKSKRDRKVYLVFKNEEAFQRVSNKVPPYYLRETGNRFGIRRDYEKDTWSRELIIETPDTVTNQDIIKHYGTDVVMKCFQLNKPKKKVQIKCSLKLNNLPLTSDDAFLRECLRTANGPKPQHLYVGCATNNASGWARITFHNEEERNKAAAIYQFKVCQNTFPIIIPGKKGPVQKFVQTTVETDDRSNTDQTQLPLPPTKNQFRVLVNNRETALKIFSSRTTLDPMVSLDWTVGSSATVTVLRTDLYPDFQEILDRICKKFGVLVEKKDHANGVIRCTFTHGSPQKTSLAASMLAQNFAPMNIKFNTDQQKQLFIELEETGEIHNWEVELGLAINKNKWNTNIEIRGPQIARGQLMRRIADYSDDFDRRFRKYELSATVATFFGKEKAASIKLQAITSRWSAKSCVVSFIPKTSTIIIMGKPKISTEDISECENEVSQLLKQITASIMNDESDEKELEEGDDVEDNGATDDEAVQHNRRCVFCREKSSISISLFRICGHAYCRCTAQFLSRTNSFPLQCQECQTVIHIRDIQMIFDNNAELFMHLLKNSIQQYLKTNSKQDDRVFCPSDECDGLIQFNRGYQTCLTCGQNVCSQCQVIDDELHVGRTCEQLHEEKKRRKFLPQLFQAAKKFVDDNWPIDNEMQPIGRVDENPYLEKQYKSLTCFYNGIAALDHSFPPDIAKGFFAYHGTAYQAIVPICKDGFDPKRRSGQAYGRGEYFGVTASISHGYSQKGGNQTGFSQMIIAYILRCAQVTTKNNFCYVVDNPVNWEYALSIPVLVVTYGQNSAAQPLPFPLDITKCDTGECSWDPPFRWYWKHDSRQFEPYNDAINEILEKFYELWKLHGGPSTITTPPLTRYLDDVPQTYQIDFQNNRQTNTKTSFPRAIERRPMSTTYHQHTWYYQDECGNWMQYQSLVQTSIEQAFKLYLSGAGASTTDITFPGRRETYQINFLKGQQTNKETNVVRTIKRQ